MPLRGQPRQGKHTGRKTKKPRPVKRPSLLPLSPVDDDSEEGKALSMITSILGRDDPAWDRGFAEGLTQLYTVNLTQAIRRRDAREVLEVLFGGEMRWVLTAVEAVAANLKEMES